MAELSTAVRRDLVDLRSMGSAGDSLALMTAVRRLRRVVTMVTMMREYEKTDGSVRVGVLVDVGG